MWWDICQSCEGVCGALCGTCMRLLSRPMTITVVEPVMLLRGEGG